MSKLIRLGRKTAGSGVVYEAEVEQHEVFLRISLRRPREYKRPVAGRLNRWFRSFLSIR